MSDIYVKDATGTSSTTWKKAVSLFVKTASGTTSAAWSAVKNVYVYFSSGWTRVWPLSGVFSITSPYITTSSGSTTPLYGVDGVRRVGSTVWGKNGTWNANGWVINSYQYRWRAYQDANINDLNIYSQTSLATYSSAVSLSIPASYDRKYLSFFIQANSSGGTAYNGYAESATEYGGLQIVRRSPLNLTTSLSSYGPQVGTQITYSSTWDETDAYAAESYRTSVYWYKNLSNSTSGGTYVGSGSTYTPQSSDLGYYLYVVETRYNSGSDYDLGSSTGVEAKIITTSTVVAGLTPPTSVNISSITRYDDSSINAVISFSGGSGPYYQLYWTTVNPAPVTASYDSASTGSPIADVFAPASGFTYYFYVRSSSQNLGDTNNNGTATDGTYSSYSTAFASYTFQSPSGTFSVSPASGTAGSTTFYADTSAISGSPSPSFSYQWEFFEGSAIGWVAISGATSSSYTPPSNYVSLYGSSLRCSIIANNGVGSLPLSSTVTVSAPLTKLATPSNVNATDTRTDGVNVTWTAVSGAAYYGVWYGPAPDYDSLADFGGNRNTSLITGTSYLDTDIGSGVTRDYYVQAYRSGDPTGTKSEWGGPNSGTRLAVVSAPSGGSVSLSGGNTPGSIITATTSGWSGSPTSYDVYITTALSPNIPTSTSSRVATNSPNTSTSVSYTITPGDAISPVNIFRAFATASNTGGTSGTVQSINTITASSAGGGGAPPVLISITGNNSLAIGGTFSWSFSNSPTAYSILVQGPTGTNYTTSNQYTYTGTSFRPGYDGTGWQGSGNYTIYVSARNSSGDSAVASVTTFMS
jgi:hypothetical protein